MKHDFASMVLTDTTNIHKDVESEKMEPLPLLYQDPYMVAIDKPSGLLVHRSMIDRRETRFALQMLRDQIGQHVYPVHRLDRPTSGVLLFALNPDIARILCESFASHQVEKTYYALVRGHGPQTLLIDYPLKEILDKKSDRRTSLAKAPQSAVTVLDSVAQAELPFAVGRYDSVRYSLLRLQPKTGRKHQLRRHMAHIRHPIIGDTTHGDGKQNAFFYQQFQLRRLMLMAYSLCLPHPVSKAKIAIRSSFDQFWLQAFYQLGWEQNPAIES